MRVCVCVCVCTRMHYMSVSHLLLSVTSVILREQAWCSELMEEGEIKSTSGIKKGFLEEGTCTCLKDE